jgi:hypothetical protein
MVNAEPHNLLGSSGAAHKVQDQRNRRQDEKYMNQPPSDVKHSNSQEPADQ